MQAGRRGSGRCRPRPSRPATGVRPRPERQPNDQLQHHQRHRAAGDEVVDEDAETAPEPLEAFAGGGFSTSKMRKRTNAAAIIARSTTTAGTPSTAGPAPVQLATAIHGRPRSAIACPATSSATTAPGSLPPSRLLRRLAEPETGDAADQQEHHADVDHPSRLPGEDEQGGDRRRRQRPPGPRSGPQESSPPALTASIGNRPMLRATSRGRRATSIRLRHADAPRSDPSTSLRARMT